MTVDWGCDLHTQVVAKLDALIDGIDDDTEDVDTPSGYPFCGCTDCVVREVLTMGWNRFEQEKA